MIQKINFNESMITSPTYTPSLLINNENWKLIKKLYDSNFLIQNNINTENIPKIIHQIWLGSTLPTKYKRLCNSWKKIHPDWEYHLWTDDYITGMNLINKHLIHKLKNLGAKSDLLRYEILYQYGGLYADTDFQCLKRFDDIHKNCSLYAGLGYNLDPEKPLVCNGLIGVKPKHPFLKKLIEEIEIQNIKNPNELMNMTGPQYLTKNLLRYAKEKHDGIIVFPVTYFYPLPNTARNNVNDVIIRAFIKKESLSVHYWHANWVKPKTIKDKFFAQLAILKKKSLLFSQQSFIMKLCYKLITSSIKIITFIHQFIKFKNLSSNDNRFRISIHHLKPCLSDNTLQTIFDRHYVYHPAWAARVLMKIKPTSHVDLSSTLYFSAIISAFIPVKFFDFRPPDLHLNNLSTAHADLLNLPFLSNSIKSLSCMHTIEHIGLGRYGDSIDPQADLKAAAELQRVLSADGNLLVVLPVGQPRIIFNAHRIYSYDQVIDLFKKCQLKEVALVQDNPNTEGLIYGATKEEVNSQKYGCGCFWFVKKI